jgi:hypothetical protein
MLGNVRGTFWYFLQYVIDTSYKLFTHKLYTIRWQIEYSLQWYAWFVSKLSIGEDLMAELKVVFQQNAFFE